MSIKVLRNWAGLASIVWMVGIFVFLNHAPENFFLFKFDSSSWVVEFSLLGIWLGIGLFFAITGLRCGKSAGQLCAIAAIIVFIYFAWHLLYPSEVPSMKAMRPNTY